LRVGLHILPRVSRLEMRTRDAKEDQDREPRAGLVSRAVREQEIEIGADGWSRRRGIPR